MELTMTTTGMLFFLLLGGLIFFTFAKVIAFARSRESEMRFKVLLFLSVFLIGFGLAWCYTSFLENEPRAAYMGLFFFSGLGLVLGVVGLRNVMEFQTTAVDSVPDDTPLAISWKQAVAIVLLAIFTITLPATWLFKSAIGFVSDRDQVTTYLGQKLLSDEALPGVIRKGLEYEAWLTRIEEPLESRIIKSAISGIERANMVALFDYIVPEKERLEVLNDLTNSLYDWLESDAIYPSLTLQIGGYVNNIEANAENLIPWLFKSFPIPDCIPAQIDELERGSHGNDLKKLIFCIPPESLQKKIVPVAAELLKAQLAENRPPSEVNVTEKMKEQVPLKKIATAKRHIRNLFLVGSTLWLVPAVLLLIGLGLAARSLKSIAVWLSWPFTMTGLLGLFIGSSLPGLSILHSVPKEAPENVPGAAIGIARKIGIDLAVMLESAMFTPFLIMALAGGLLLVLIYREKIVSAAIKTRLSLGVVFGN